MYTMSIDAATITAAHETTSSRMTFDRGVHHRRVETIVTTYAFHAGRGQRHANKEPVIVATTTVRVISTTIAAIEVRKSDSNEHHGKETASAKRRSISRLRGASTSLDTARLPSSFSHFLRRTAIS